MEVNHGNSWDPDCRRTRDRESRLELKIPKLKKTFLLKDFCLARLAHLGQLGLPWPGVSSDQRDNTLLINPAGHFCSSQLFYQYFLGFFGQIRTLQYYITAIVTGEFRSELIFIDKILHCWNNDMTTMKHYINVHQKIILPSQFRPRTKLHTSK